MSPSTQLIIRPQDIKEEFNYLWWTLKDMSFCQKNNYKVELPNHPVFLDLAQKSPNFGRVNKTKIFNLFQKEVYDPNFFKQGIITLENYRSIFNQAIPKFMDFRKKWDFKIFPQYNVLLTRYGPGGSYNPDQGTIIMLTDIDGKFPVFRPDETIVHEIIHLGIEENIVNFFKLNHLEKETLVDLICILKFKDILPNYQIQSISNPNISKYLTSKSVDNLPKTIQSYIDIYPR